MALNAAILSTLLFLGTFLGRAVGLSTANEAFTLQLAVQNFTNFNASYADLDTDLMCTWPYVTCDPAGNLVQWDVSNLGIAGNLTSSIGDFLFLRVLRLNGNNLTGPLPPQLSHMLSLEEVDLSHNGFSGAIPAALANLPNLTSLNLAYNNFSPPIPLALALTNLSCTEHLEGNPGLNIANLSTCFPQKVIYTAPSTAGATSWRPILGGVGGGVALFLLLAAALLVAYWAQTRRGTFGFKRLSTADMADIEAGVDRVNLDRIRRFQLSEIHAATDSFAPGHILGEGGTAIVYKGVVPDTLHNVAVKRFKSGNGGKKQIEQFVNEVDLISRAAHRNVLPLTGFCLEMGEMVLVFPLMANGSVDAHLAGGRKEEGCGPLPMAARRAIAVGVAEGLAYLHDQCSTPVVHGDIKAANVLLSDHFTPCIADFGLAKVVDPTHTHTRVAGVAGTIGHIAPEFYTVGETSEKTDVYAFGVFLLELLSGRNGAQLAALPKEGQSLQDWAWRSFDEGSFGELIDVEVRMMDLVLLDGEYGVEAIADMVALIALCLSEQPEDRPTMAQTLTYLKGEDDVIGRARERAGLLGTEPYEDSGGGLFGNSAYSVGSTEEGISVVGVNIAAPR